VGGRRFTDGESESGVRGEVAQICVSGDDFVHHLPHLWQRTIDNLGYYFEGCSDILIVVCAVVFDQYSLCVPI